MAFIYDVFINHAIDDDTPEDNVDGWASDLKKFLTLVLERLLNRNVKVFTSRELLNSIPYQNIPRQDLFRKTAVYVPVISQAYLSDKAAQQQLLEIGGAISASRWNTATNRLYKVMKCNIPLVKHPFTLHNSMGYRFYNIDAKSGQTNEFKSIKGADAERDYWAHLVDLAYDISDRIRTFEQATAKTTVSKQVFLADTSPDLEQEREMILRELKHNGYQILPNKPLPTSVQHQSKAIHNYLEDCSYTVHLVGKNHQKADKDTPTDSQLQHNLCLEHNKNRKNSDALKIIIWMPPELGLLGRRDKAMLEQTRREFELHQNTEVIQTPIEQFKSILLQKLTTPQDQPEQQQTGHTAYVMLQPNDDGSFEKIESLLVQKKIQVLYTPEKGTQGLLHAHKTNLITCDAALIYISKTNHPWVNSKLLDIAKAPGFGRKKAFKTVMLLNATGTPILSDLKKTKVTELLMGTNNLDMQKGIEKFTQFFDSGIG